MLEDGAPPNKRLKLQASRKPFCPNRQNNHAKSVQPSPKPENRKRKIPKRQTSELQLLDLNSHVLMEVFEYLSVDDLCNLAETNIRTRQLARNAFQWRARNGLNFYQTRILDYVLLKRVLDNFGNTIKSISINTTSR